MGRILLGFIMSIGFIGIASAQNTPAPCGPAGDLSAELSTNVASDSRCFELRMYTAEPEQDGVGGINNLHKRFREQEIAIFEKLGAEVVAVWQRLDDPNTLVLLMEYDSLDNMRKWSQSEELQEAMQRAGVIDPGEAYELEELEKGAI